MKHDSVVFNFQEIIGELRVKAEKLKKEKNEEIGCQSMLDAITEETEFEDLPLYKEYLSGFDVEHDLEGLELSYDSIQEDYKDDFPMFLRLAAASFSNTYNLDYNAETGKVELTINAVSGNITVAKKLDTLWSFQIARLFEIYVGEQLNLAGLRELSAEEKREIDEERNQQLVLYQEKIRTLKNQRERLLDER